MRTRSSICLASKGEGQGLLRGCRCAAGPPGISTLSWHTRRTGGPIGLIGLTGPCIASAVRLSDFRSYQDSLVRSGLRRRSHGRASGQAQVRRACSGFRQCPVRASPRVRLEAWALRSRRPVRDGLTQRQPHLFPGFAELRIDGLVSSQPIMARSEWGADRLASIRPRGVRVRHTLRWLRSAVQRHHDIAARRYLAQASWRLR